MADVTGPFDGVLWTQDAWYRHAPRWAPSGVWGSPAASTSSGDLPFSNSGLSVGVGNGRAWVRGSGFERVDGVSLAAIAANTNASLSRRDRLVLRRDLAAKTLTPVALIGTPSGTPTAPSLVRVETGQWDIPLYSWLTPPNSGTNLTSIADERPWCLPHTSMIAFGSTAARDAYFVSPAVGDKCDIGGVVYRYDGTNWDTTPQTTLFTPTYLIPSGGSVVYSDFTGGGGVAPLRIYKTGTRVLAKGAFTYTGASFTAPANIDYPFATIPSACTPAEGREDDINYFLSGATTGWGIASATTGGQLIFNPISASLTTGFSWRFDLSWKTAL